MGVDNAANTEITLLSARERIIQSVGVHLFVTGERIPPVVEDKMEEKENEMKKITERMVDSLVCY